MFAFEPVPTTFAALTSNSKHFPFSNVTLHNIEFVFFELSSTQLALKNTFILGVLSATIGTVIALVIGYLTADEGTQDLAQRVARHGHAVVAVGSGLGRRRHRAAEGEVDGRGVFIGHDPAQFDHAVGQDVRG